MSFYDFKDSCWVIQRLIEYIRFFHKSFYYHKSLAKKYRIVIETSAFIHGEYDWMLTITADDIKQAKQFSELLLNMYPSGTKKIVILQTMMFVRKNYVLNPDREKLKQFYLNY